ncbi:MAG TPA: serine--tRNA ligase [Candidatus Saccharimonadales bacterium]|nr:serine--tRNA ligase [Candidatus Saccharimonadales bacterium]
MLDIQFIRENPEEVAQKTKQKGYEVNVHELLRFDEERRELLGAIEAVRAKRNDNAAKMKNGKPAPELIEQGKAIKAELAELEERFAVVDEAFAELLMAVPNMPLADVPVGLTEDENQIAKTVGDPTAFDFEPKQHWELAEPRGLIDKERAAKIAGSRFAYLKGDIVRLQFAIVQFVMQTLGDEQIIEKLVKENGLNITAKPFTPILPPAMLRTEPYVASARLNAEEVTYKIEQDDLWLNASAEHTLCTMYWNEILPEEQLPIRYLGYSTSFRREAGTYGKDAEGIFRMHQFDKLEMEVFSTPETGLDEHLLLVAIQEYLLRQLGIPYRVVQKCTADIGKPNARGIDMDAWLPGQNAYRETHTADYMTDYQARDLKIRTRRKDGSIVLVHTNDATAFALGRTMIAIMENCQTADGHVIIPEVLRPFMGGKSEI